jgi:hypothetical protein
MAVVKQDGGCIDTHRAHIIQTAMFLQRLEDVKRLTLPDILLDSATSIVSLHPLLPNTFTFETGFCSLLPSAISLSILTFEKSFLSRRLTFREQRQRS